MGHILQIHNVVDAEPAHLGHVPVPLAPGGGVAPQLRQHVDPDLQPSGHLAGQQQLPGLLLLVLGHIGVECAHHIFNGVLLIAAVGLFPLLQFVQGDPEIPGDIPHRDLPALHELGVLVAGG